MKEFQYVQTQIFSPRIGDGLHLHWVNLEIEGNLEEARDKFNKLYGSYPNYFETKWLGSVEPEGWIEQLIILDIEAPRLSKSKILSMFNHVTGRPEDFHNSEIDLGSAIDINYGKYSVELYEEYLKKEAMLVFNYYEAINRIPLPAVNSLPILGNLQETVEKVLASRHWIWDTFLKSNGKNIDDESITAS